MPQGKTPAPAAAKKVASAALAGSRKRNAADVSPPEGAPAAKVAKKVAMQAML